MKLEAISAEAKRLPPRIIVCGAEKVGKTTFSCGSRIDGGSVVEVGRNAPIVIPIDGEEGADELPVAKFPAAANFADVLDDLGELAIQPHTFQTVVIDSASALESLIWSATVEEGKKSKGDIANIEDFGYGKGYILALDKWRELLERLDYLRKARGMTCILIAHTVAKTVATPDTEPYDAHVLDVHKAAALLLLRWADLILYAHVRATIKKDGKAENAHRRAIGSEGERLIATRKTASHPGGGRGALGRLPEILPLDWAEYTTAVDAAYGVPNNNQTPPTNQGTK